MMPHGCPGDVLVMRMQSMPSCPGCMVGVCACKTHAPVMPCQDVLFRKEPPI